MVPRLGDTKRHGDPMLLRPSDLIRLDEGRVYMTEVNRVPVFVRPYDTHRYYLEVGDRVIRPTDRPTYKSLSEAVTVAGRVLDSGIPLKGHYGESVLCDLQS